MNAIEEPPKAELSADFRALLEQEVAQITVTAAAALEQIILTAAARLQREICEREIQQ